MASNYCTLKPQNINLQKHISALNVLTNLSRFNLQKHYSAYYNIAFFTLNLPHMKLAIICTGYQKHIRNRDRSKPREHSRL